MAKKKVQENMVELTSWDEVDVALKDIAVLQSRITSETAIYNEDEQKRRAVLERKIGPMREKVESYENGLKDFCENNRGEFVDRKSKDLTHGLVAFRMSPPSVKTKKGWTLSSVLEFINSSATWAARFIRTKQELDKERILSAIASNEVPEADFDRIGLIRCQDESFYYEVKLAAE